MKIKTKEEVLLRTLEGVYTLEVDSIKKQLSLIKEENKDTLKNNLNYLIIDLEIFVISNLKKFEDYKLFAEKFKSIRNIILKIGSKKGIDLKKIQSLSSFKAITLLEEFSQEKKFNLLSQNIILNKILICQKDILENNKTLEDSIIMLETIYLSMISIIIYEIKDNAVVKIIEDLNNE